MALIDITGNNNHYQKGNKMKLTMQRKILLEELKKLKSHPTADDFFVILRKKLPKISLGSVYRNLEALSSTGMIKKLECAGSQKRFDGDTSDHFHLRCDVCGKVSDYFGSNVLKIDEVLKKICEEESFIGCNLEFFGTCANCKQ